MVRIMLSLGSDEHQIVPDLTEEELAAIGTITVSWAYLEHEIFAITSELADAWGVPLPTDASQSSFKRRALALKNLVKVNGAPNDAATLRLLKCITDARNLERSRHRITHGLWDWEPADPHALISGSYRPSFDFREPFDLPKLVRLADRINELNFRLSFPEGKKGALEELAARGPHVAREFLLRLAAQRPAGRRRHRPTRPTNKRPQRE